MHNQILIDFPFVINWVPKKTGILAKLAITPLKSTNHRDF